LDDVGFRLGEGKKTRKKVLKVHYIILYYIIGTEREGMGRRERERKKVRKQARKKEESERGIIC